MKGIVYGVLNNGVSTNANFTNNNVFNLISVINESYGIYNNEGTYFTYMNNNIIHDITGILSIGIFNNGTDVSISKNTIFSSVIGIKNLINNTTIDNNNIYQNRGTGVINNGNYSNITSNILNNNSKCIENNGNNLKIDKNNIYQNKISGILNIGNNVLITVNTITNNNDGIENAGNNVKISSNNLNSNKYSIFNKITGVNN